MFKNVATKLVVFAYDSTTSLPKTGDAANITAYVSKDYGTVTVLADTSATEMDSTNAKGFYLFDLAQAETNGDALTFSAKSSTSNIVVLAIPAVVFTTPPNFTKASIDGTSGKIAATTASGDDADAASVLAIASDGTNGNAAIKTAVAAIPTAPALASVWTGTLATNLGTLAGHDPGGTLASHADATAIESAVGAIPTNPLLASSYTPPDNASVTAIKAKTDNLPSDPADASDIAAAFAVVDSAISALAATSLLRATWTDAKAAFIDAAISSVSAADPYLAARVYGAVDPETLQGQQVFRSPPNATDGGGIPKVKFTRTTPAGRTVELDPT